MKVLILSLTTVFTIMLFGISDVYADHSLNYQSHGTLDVRINNCTSFTVFGNTDEPNHPFRFGYEFYEYLGKDDNNQPHFISYEELSNWSHSFFPNKDGSFEFTVSVPMTKTVKNYGFNERTGNWVSTNTYDITLSKLYQGHVDLYFSQSHYKPHRSDFVVDNTIFDVIGNSTKINVRNNTDTNQLCFYKITCPYKYCNYPDDYTEVENTPSIQEPTAPKTKLQIANENITNLETQIDKFETKKDKLKGLKDNWKEKFKQCKDDRKDLRTEVESYKSKFNTIESLYNTTETQRSELERLYTDLDLEHDRVKQELDEAKNTISGLYSQYYDLQSIHNSTLNELNELRDRMQELDSQ